MTSRYARITPTALMDCGRAVLELALARRTLGRAPSSELTKLAARQDGREPAAALDDENRRLLERVTIAIRRAAHRVPWRSDCLVQALAAQRWLAAKGIAAQLNLGARKGESADFAAHAWLCVGDLIVTGGDVSEYSRFERAERE